jgi:hypothetical protein
LCNTNGNILQDEKWVESQYYRIAVREIAFIPTHKNQVPMIRIHKAKEGQRSSPEVLDIAEE